MVNSHGPDQSELFRLLVEEARDYAIFLLSVDGTVASWNKGAQRIKGYTAAEIIGQHFSRFYPPEEAARGRPKQMLELATRDGRVEIEGWRLRKDGSRFWANVVLTALRDAEGRLLGFSKVTRDLTDRRFAEEELRQSEERLRLLIESVKDYAIYMLDPDGRVVSWNAGAERIKGYAASEIIGHSYACFYPPEDRAAGKPAEALERAARDGSFEEEGWRVRKDGSRFWASAVMTAVRNADGRLRGFAKVTRDLTARHLAEERERQLIREQAARSAAESHAAALRASEERYRQSSEQLSAVLAGVSDAITMLDNTGRIVFANEAAARILGFPDVASLLSVPVAKITAGYELYDEDGNPLPPERLPGRSVAAGGPTEERLLRFRLRGTGEERWSLVRATAAHDAEGRVQFVINVFRDVTERLRQQESLRLSQEWLATVLRSIGDAVITTDATGLVTFMNPIAEQLTGWSSADVAGQPLGNVFVIINEETRQSVESPVERAIREGRAVGLANHTILIRKDGSEIFIDDSASPIRDHAGRLVGVVLTFRDISEKRREEWRRNFIVHATLDLNSSLDYQTTLAAVARSAVPAFADWCAVDVIENDRLERLAVEHINPAKVEWVKEAERRYPPDPNAAQGVPNILRTGQPELIESIPTALLESLAIDEQHLQIIRQLQLRSYIGVPLIARGKTIGAITFVMAESNRRYDRDDLAVAMQLADRAANAIDNARLFREMEQARHTAELANRSKDEFLAVLGHELRNPLAPIMTALQLLKLRAGSAFERERTVIERQLKHVVRLVDDLLDVSRITRGKIELRKEPVELGDVVAKALEMSSPLLEERRHDVQVAVPKGLWVEGDPVRLAQVVGNLLNNAAKYTEKGGRIAITAERTHDTIALRVTDNGMGIAPEMLPRVFDLFVQERQALDRAQGGLGLGLAIVRSLVQLHGGTVSTASEGVGRGTEVTVRLPALDVKEVMPSVRSPAPPAPDARAVRILLVDDNSDAVQLLGEALELHGYRTAIAHDGPSALVLAEQVHPQVAILDIGLPVMDGYELAHRLRQLKGLSDLLLVAVTGYGQPSDRRRAAAAGFDELLVKPVEIESVQRVLDRLLGTNRR